MIPDTFHLPAAKQVDGDEPVADPSACSCHNLGALPRGHNHHPLCDIWMCWPNEAGITRESTRQGPGC